MSEPVHGFFGLTYANYLVLHRTILQSMPEDWQARFVGVMDELQAAMGEGLQDKIPSNYDIRIMAREPEWKYPDCDPCEGKGTVEVENTDEHGTTIDEVDCEACDGSGTDYDGEQEREEPEDVGFIDDPIPHYNRGRTQLDLESGLELIFCHLCGERHTRAVECCTDLKQECLRCDFTIVGLRTAHEGCDIQPLNGGCWRTLREIGLPN